MWQLKFHFRLTRIQIDSLHAHLQYVPNNWEFLHSIAAHVFFLGLYLVPFSGPGFFGAGVTESINHTIHSQSRSVSLIPASIAGDTRNVW